MTHFTLILNKPESILKDRFPRVSLANLHGTSQFSAWDGPARKSDALKLYHALSPYCSGIGLFAGKDRGRCVASQGNFS